MGFALVMVWAKRKEPEAWETTYIFPFNKWVVFLIHCLRLHSDQENFEGNMVLGNFIKRMKNLEWSWKFVGNGNGCANLPYRRDSVVTSTYKEIILIPHSLRKVITTDTWAQEFSPWNWFYLMDSVEDVGRKDGLFCTF